MDVEALMLVCLPSMKTSSRGKLTWISAPDLSRESAGPQPPSPLSGKSNTHCEVWTTVPKAFVCDF